MGYKVPAHVNPADAYLDIVSGAILPKSGQALDVAACWRMQQYQHQQGPASGAASRQPVGPGQTSDEDDAAAAFISIAASRRTSQEAAVAAAESRAKVSTTTHQA